MNEQQDPEEAVNSGKAHLKAAANDFKEAANDKIEDLRQSAAQTTAEFQSAAEEKAREFQKAAQGAYANVSSKAKTWQAESELFVHQSPGKAILIALFSGFLFGLLTRK